MEEINIQEWDNIQPDPISDKTKIELALIDLYNRLAMQVPTNHQEILNELSQRLLSQEASLTVKQVDGSLESSISETKLRVDRAYNFLREMKLNEVPKNKKRDQDYMYNWIRSKSGK